MKRYSIDSPEKLKAAVPLMKNRDGVWAANNLAVAWSAAARRGQPDAFTVYINLGRNAFVFRLSQKSPVIVGEMYLAKAREFVKDLKEVPLE
ncbi:MAG: hypothetical protein IKO07_06235 [Clostridia bacterium]|nr:hypothetical protein [Clostridia bacterium]